MAQRIILKNFSNVLGWRQVVIENIDIEGVHQIRVAARRTRTALQTFSALWPEAEVTYHIKHLAQFADTFGVSRDLDVMLVYLEEQLQDAHDERAVAYKWLHERNHRLRMDEQPKLTAVINEMESAGFAARFVDYFSRRPYDLWAGGEGNG